MIEDGRLVRSLRSYESPHRPVLLEIIRAGLASDADMMAVLGIATGREDLPLLEAIRAGLQGRDELAAAARDFLTAIGKDGLL